MNPTCIVSFDCESKWGLADIITGEVDQLFTCRNILQTYQDSLAILADFGVPATFAFVGAFTLDSAEFCEMWRSKLTASPEHKVWLSRLFSDLDAGKTEGWFMPEALSLVREAGPGHEIASQGFTHLPLRGASAAAHALERDGIRYWMERRGLRIETFVFPRNLTTEAFPLEELGVRAYRDQLTWRSGNGTKERIASLFREFYPFARAQFGVSHSDKGFVRIPGDFFLNWRSGGRRLVPSRLTVYRFRHALEDAVRNGGVVHLWLHPHNLLTGHCQKELFRDCVRQIEEYVRRGDLVVKTQAEFAQLNGGSMVSGTRPG